jgi:2,3-bisphosphoglycerate-independent phosphoglycerate mutase
MVDAPSPHPTLTARSGPIVLCILDGVGLGSGDDYDAVATSRMPVLTRLMAEHPWCRLAAHGTAVGLPTDGDMGNSEVGHNAMGAGRVFAQGARLVNEAFASGAIFESPLWTELCGTSTLHLMGLVSDGNVHSHVDHLRALIERAAADGVSRLRVHVLTDGRDVGKRTALTWVGPMEEALAAHRAEGRDYRVASGGGRMHLTMDRYEADWAMVARGWRCHVHGEGRPFASATEAIETLYADDPQVDDQWLPAFVIVDEADQPVGRIGDGDGVLFFNFRGDRAIEISRAFEEDGLDTFDRGHRPEVLYAGMMQYDGDLMVPKRYLVEPPAIDRVMGEYLVAAGKRTFATSETQKFGHVTFFFNGNRSGRLDASLETYHEVPSDTLPFDERPWMKAAEITDAVVEAIGSGDYDHVRLNLANGDMVGHTGVLEATRVALEAVDLQLGRLEQAVREAGGVLLVTADHGNADDMAMRDKQGRPKTDEGGAVMPRTSHTLSPVPFVVVDPEGRLDVAQVESPGLASVASTVLALCGLQPPDDYAPCLVRLRE